MRYITIPNQISFNNIKNKGFCLAPSKYLDFYLNKNVKYKTLDTLVEFCKFRKKIINSQIYNYIEIGNINVESGFINADVYYGCKLPSSNPISVKKNDILISTVRTYRRGIGIVTSDKENIVCTPALLNIREVDDDITKEYLLAILRSDFFIEQILQNRGMYPRLDKDSAKFVYIPLLQDKNVLTYISILQRAILNKEIEIDKKNNQINSLIESELLKNQKNINFTYEMPKFKEILIKSRIDTGIYTYEFKDIDFIIKNYKNGYFYLNEKKIKSGSTPPKRFIGNKDFYKYKWITPSHFTDYGTLIFNERIQSEKNNLNENAMLLINRTSKGGRGEYVGIALFYDINNEGIAHHNQGIYRVIDYPDLQLKFMTCFMNCKIIRKYCAGLSVGSKMKEIKSNHFLTIPFPVFPLEKQNEICNLYHNTISYPNSIVLENFIYKDDEWNKQASIYELDNSAKLIKGKLNEIIDNIVNDKPIIIDFSF